jgi:hypothetical protein
MITVADLNGYLGKNISAICANNYARPADNHCAHFVSHALNYSFGYTCKMAVAGATHPGANLRVHEVFSRCLNVGRWDDKPAVLTSCLIFVTGASNVHLATKSMDNVPRKHIGIYIGGTIWHYSNSHHKVVTQVPAEFIKHYPGPGIALFYGQLI